MADSDEGAENNENESTDSAKELERYKAKFELEKGHRRNAESKNKDFESQLNDLQARFDAAEEAKIEAAAKKSGNLEDYKKSQSEKTAKSDLEWQGKIDDLTKTLEATTIGRDAANLSARLFGGDSETFQHVVADRLAMVDSKTMVLDADGKHSALTLDELHDELYNDKRYSRFVVGSNASGGGANGSSAKNGGGASQIHKGDLSRANPKDLVAHLTAKKGNR